MKKFEVGDRACSILHGVHGGRGAELIVLTVKVQHAGVEAGHRESSEGNQNRLQDTHHTTCDIIGLITYPLCFKAVFFTYHDKYVHTSNNLIGKKVVVNLEYQLQSDLCNP